MIAYGLKSKIQYS